MEGRLSHKAILPRPLKEWYILKLLFSYSTGYATTSNETGTNTNSSRLSAGDEKPTNPIPKERWTLNLQPVGTRKRYTGKGRAPKGSFGSRTFYSQWWGWCERGTETKPVTQWAETCNKLRPQRRNPQHGPDEPLYLCVIYTMNTLLLKVISNV